MQALMGERRQRFSSLLVSGRRWQSFTGAYSVSWYLNDSFDCNIENVSFHMGWHMLFMQSCVTNFFILFFSLLSSDHSKFQSCSLIYWYFNFVSFFLILKFYSWHFFKFWFVFNFRIESIIVIYNFFLNMVSLLWLWFLIVDLFVNLVFFFQFLPLIQNSKMSSYLYFILNFIFILLIAFFYFGSICLIDFFNLILQYLIYWELSFVIFSRREAFSSITRVTNLKS